MRLFLPILTSVSCGFLSGKLPELAPLPEIEPVTKDELTASITRGVDYLIMKQNKDGSFGGPRRTKGLNIYAPVPEAHLAFRSGSTTLALAGLIDSRDRRPEVIAAIDKCEAWMLTKLPTLRHIDPTTTYNVWGHSYGLRALADLYQYRKGDDTKRSRIKEVANQQIERLKSIEDVNGGWGYLDLDDMHTAHFSGIPTSFSTATALLAMKEAQKIMGIEIPMKQVKRGLDSIEKQRTPDWSFVYAITHRYRPRYGINRPAGSLARSQVCIAAMQVFGDERITDELIQHWQHRLCLREGWLSIGRKRPVPHETHFSISGYFYYYGFYYATECLEILPLEKRQEYIPHLSRHLLTKQEKDGSWWDYPLYDYHQAYGTGYTLTALSRLRNSLQ